LLFFFAKIRHQNKKLNENILKLLLSWAEH